MQICKSDPTNDDSVLKSRGWRWIEISGVKSYKKDRNFKLQTGYQNLQMINTIIIYVNFLYRYVWLHEISTKQYEQWYSSNDRTNNVNTQ